MSELQTLLRHDDCLSLPGAATWRVRRTGLLRVRPSSPSAVWLTVDGEAKDRVLQPGEELELRRGHRIVVEPWVAGTTAKLCWLTEAPARQQARAWRLGGVASDTR
jgi:hypothetical protein